MIYTFRVKECECECLFSTPFHKSEYSKYVCHFNLFNELLFELLRYIPHLTRIHVPYTLDIVTAVGCYCCCLFAEKMIENPKPGNYFSWRILLRTKNIQIRYLTLVTQHDRKIIPYFSMQNIYQRYLLFEFVFVELMFFQHSIRILRFDWEYTKYFRGSNKRTLRTAASEWNVRSFLFWHH